MEVSDEQHSEFLRRMVDYFRLLSRFHFVFLFFGRLSRVFSEFCLNPTNLFGLV